MLPERSRRLRIASFSTKTLLDKSRLNTRYCFMLREETEISSTTQEEKHMPYIRVQVLGGASPTGSGKMIVDGQRYVKVKQGQMIYVALGTHSVAYKTTLRGTRCSTVCDFASDSMVTAFVRGSCSEEETQRLLDEASDAIADCSRENHILISFSIHRSIRGDGRRGWGSFGGRWGTGSRNAAQRNRRRICRRSRGTPFPPPREIPAHSATAS